MKPATHRIVQKLYRAGVQREYYTIKCLKDIPIVNFKLCIEDVIARRGELNRAGLNLLIFYGEQVPKRVEIQEVGKNCNMRYGYTKCIFQDGSWFYK